MMTFPSIAASLLVLVLWSWLAGLCCFARGHCVEMDHVASLSPSRTVPFHSGMEVGYILEGVPLKNYEVHIGFYIREDDRDVAAVYVQEDANNNLEEFAMKFNKGGWVTNLIEVNKSECFQLGIQRRVCLVYSNGFFNVTFWNADRQPERTWSRSDAATMGRGNLTTYVRIADRKPYTSVIYWPCTSHAPEKPEKHCMDSDHLDLHLIVLALIVVILVLLVLLYIKLRRTLGSQKVKDESKDQNTGNEDLTPAPPLHHRPQEGQVFFKGGNLESVETINSIYGYRETINRIYGCRESVNSIYGYQPCD